MDKMNSEYSVDATKYETKDDMYKYYKDVYKRQAMYSCRIHW